MSVTRQQVHELVEVVDASELDIIYRLLTKFIPEDDPTPDEVEAIRIGRGEAARGDVVRHEDIDWG